MSRLIEWLRNFSVRFSSSRSQWFGYAFALNSTFFTIGFNLLVIGLIVSMLISSRLEIYHAKLENEVALVHPPQGFQKASLGNDEAGAARQLSDYTLVASRDLFATKKSAPSLPPPAKEEDLVIDEMPLASLKLKLMGTVVASDSGMSSAIIAEANGRNEQMYHEGESVKGATIKKILRNTVVVNTGKRDEVLKMDTGDQAGGKKTSARSDQSQRATPVQVVTLNRTEIEQSLKDVPSLLKSAKFSRYTSGGAQGFKVRSMAKGSAFSKLGLRSNDIILGANGEPLRDLRQATALYEQLEKGGQVSVNIKRFGRDRDIALRLK